MKVRLCAITAALVLASLCGCRDKAKQMSRYPYYLTTLDERWEVARESFRSAEPNVGLSVVLLKDIEGAIVTMKKGYNAPNRDAAIAKIEALWRDLRAEFNRHIDLASVNLRLRPGHTAKDVGAAIDEFYPQYRAFAEMVKQ